MTVISISSRRTSLASFKNCYAVAVQLRETTGVDQFVVRTDNAIQPFRVTRKPYSPASPDLHHSPSLGLRQRA